MAQAITDAMWTRLATASAAYDAARLAKDAADAAWEATREWVAGPDDSGVRSMGDEALRAAVDDAWTAFQAASAEQAAALTAIEDAE